MDHCNNFHPTIKFTFDYDFKTKSVIFLDLIIWIDEQGYIQTDLYKKAEKNVNMFLQKMLIQTMFSKAFHTVLHTD